MLELHGYGLAAMFLFAIAALLAGVMVMPRKAGFALDRLEEAPSVPPGFSAYTVFADRLQKKGGMNRGTLDRMFLGMKVLPLLVAAELLCWVNHFSSLRWEIEVGWLVPLALLGIYFLGRFVWRFT